MFTQHATHPRVPTFKHYSRKGYSVFASLKREVRIGVLGVVLVSTAQVAKADVQQPQRQLRRTEGTEQALDETTPQGGLLTSRTECTPLAVATASAPQVHRPRSTRRADTLPAQPLPHSFMLRQRRIHIGLPGNARRRVLHPRPIDWPMHHLHPTYTASPPHTSPPRPLPLVQP